MAVKLRTRLFLVVAVLLGASIAVSALLSRRATLVEIRAIVTNMRPQPDPAPILDRVASEVERTAPDGLAIRLAALERDTSRRVLVIDATRRVVAASSPMLATARVTAMTADGRFGAELGPETARSVIEIRGAPVRSVTGRGGRPLTVVLLPPEDKSDPVPGGVGAPLWVWTTIATGLIAVPLVFAVARRILNPITALTEAAHRMQSGDLDVRVDVRGRDELAELARAFNGMAARVAEN